MGMFTKKSKARDQDGYGLGEGADSSTLKSSLTFKRKQKPVIATLPQIDISTALPDTNDFRTSMLMPQLSARFSMLREQDDPNTKVGKASDDSVLFPKRASRMNLFSHNPLTDIAEVESIHSTIRPPFANSERSYSISDGYASDDGASIMGRSRHGEGNSLFGGRQKIYRIADGASSSKTLTGGSGKHTYGDDVSLSIFQQYRQQVKDDSYVNGDTNGDNLRNSREEQDEAERVQSPFTAFSKNRGTTSSTTSGPSNRRTSTAATSVTCESPIPRHNSGHASKPRTSDILNGSEEPYMKRNPSSDSRRNFNVRDDTFQPPLPKPLTMTNTLSQSRSAVNLSDKYSRPSPFSTNTVSRAVSPPPLSAHALGSLEFGALDSAKSGTTQLRRYQTASPTSDGPRDDEADGVYSNALQPNDRGKATAMGLFNRPVQQFDEQQFLQRQRQMHEGRSSPYSPELRSESQQEGEITSPAMRQIDSALGTHEASRISTTSQDARTDARTNAAPSPFAKKMQTFNATRSENQVIRPRKKSDAPAAASSHANVKARVESLIRRQNAELTALEEEKGFPINGKIAREPSVGAESLSQSNRGTFFNGFDGSDDEIDESPRRESKSRVAPRDVHPALRNGMNDFDFGDSVPLTQPSFSRQSAASNYSVTPSVQHEHIPLESKGSESPTLGSSGLGLSGLVSRHLRNDSDRSSLPPASPAMTGFPRSTASREVSMASARTANPPESIHSDPWEFDRAPRSQQSIHHGDRHGFEPHSPAMSSKAQQFFGRDEPRSKAQQILGHEAPHGAGESANEKNWQDELQSSHHRGESTETARERREFDDDLAERQRKIQERLKEMTVVDQRSRSPIRQGLPQAFQGLRHKNSRGNMVPPSNEPQASSKAMKMLGISGPAQDMHMRSPNPNMQRERGYEQEVQHDERQWRPHQQRGPPPIDPNYPPSSGRRTPGGRTTPHGNPSYEEFERQRQRSATPNSGRTPSAGRHRANSGATNRSRSRQGGPYRDDEGYPPPHPDSRYSPPNMRNGPSPDQIRGQTPNGHRDEGRSASAMGNRARNNSRPQGPGYFDNRGPVASGPHSIAAPGDMPPRPSPRPPVLASPIAPSYNQPSPGFSGPPQNYNSSAASPALGPSLSSSSRKKSVSKGMISEPLFVSSTSSVPLVGLPSGPAGPGPRPRALDSPPVPAMNPDRRRVRAGTIGQGGGSASAPGSALNSPLAPMGENSHGDYAVAAARHAYDPHSQQPMYNDPQQYGGKPAPRPRNRLRKTSSEGGNMSARARQQAYRDEYASEKMRSPAIGPAYGGGFDGPRTRPEVFPNRSATSLGMAHQQDGGMF